MAFFGPQHSSTAYIYATIASFSAPVIVVMSTLTTLHEPDPLDAFLAQFDRYPVPTIRTHFVSRCTRRHAREFFAEPAAPQLSSVHRRCIGRTREARTPSHRARRRR